MCESVCLSVCVSVCICVCVCVCVCERERERERERDWDREIERDRERERVKERDWESAYQINLWGEWLKRKKLSFVSDPIPSPKNIFLNGNEAQIFAYIVKSELSTVNSLPFPIFYCIFHCINLFLFQISASLYNNAFKSGAILYFVVSEEENKKYFFRSFSLVISIYIILFIFLPIHRIFFCKFTIWKLHLRRKTKEKKKFVKRLLGRILLAFFILEFFQQFYILFFFPSIIIFSPKKRSAELK